MERKGKLPLSRSAEEEVEESGLKQGHEAARQRLQWGPARGRWQQGSWASTGGVGRRLRRSHGHPRGIQQQQPRSSCLPAKGRKGKKGKKSHKI